MSHGSGSREHNVGLVQVSPRAGGLLQAIDSRTLVFRGILVGISVEHLLYYCNSVPWYSVYVFKVFLEISKQQVPYIVWCLMECVCAERLRCSIRVDCRV